MVQLSESHSILISHDSEQASLLLWVVVVIYTYIFRCYCYPFSFFLFFQVELYNLIHLINVYI